MPLRSSCIAPEAPLPSLAIGTVATDAPAPSPVTSLEYSLPIAGVVAGDVPVDDGDSAGAGSGELSGEVRGTLVLEQGFKELGEEAMLTVVRVEVDVLRAVVGHRPLREKLRRGSSGVRAEQYENPARSVDDATAPVCRSEQFLRRARAAPRWLWSVYALRKTTAPARGLSHSLQSYGAMCQVRPPAQQAFA